jgi:hypothetical protein
LLEAGSAEHGTALRGLEGHGGFRSALRANGSGFGANTAAGSGYPLNLALLAPLRIVLELLVVKKQLFPSGKDEVVTAIRTLQNLVHKVHNASPSMPWNFSIHPPTNC